MDEFISEIGSGGQPIDATVIIKGATFSGNTAANGGAFLVSGGTVKSAANGTADNMEIAASDGSILITPFVPGGEIPITGVTTSGAIPVALQATISEVTIADSIFSGNTAAQGGAIASENGKLTFSGSTFTANFAGAGGAIYTTGGNLEVVDAVFSGNTAANGGGAIYAQDGGLKIAGGTFRHASDTVRCIGGSSRMTLGGTICTAAQIYAENAIDFDDNTRINITISGSTAGNVAFLGNYDTAFANDENLSLTVTLSAAQAAGKYLLADNAANFDKEVALCVDGTEAGTVSLDTALTVDGRQYLLSQDDGDVFLSVGGKVVENAGVVTANGIADTVVIGGVTYTGARYSQGRINDALNNHTIVAAQGVSCSHFEIAASSKTLVMDQSSVSGGHDRFGGGCYNEGGTVSIFNSDFFSNTADNQGGAIYNSGVAEVNGCNFFNNSAGMYYGGAFYNDVRSTFTISASTFSNNTATHYGAAIYSESSGSGRVDDSMFSGNVSQTGGAAILNSGSIEINRGVFLDNVSRLGGAIYNSGEAQIMACVFSGNAGATGGAIYNGAGGSVEIFDSSFLTSSDSIYNYNKSIMVVGGTIRTAANITSANEIIVEDGFNLIIDLSSYETSDGMREILTGYDTMFAGAGYTQRNLSITVNVPQNACGHYLLATGADKFDRSITVADAFGTPLGTLSLTGPSSFVLGDQYYSLGLSNGDLVLTVVQNQGIVTSDSSIYQVEIDGKTYSGRWYSMVRWALQSEQTVVVQGVNCERIDFFTCSYNNAKLIADHIVISNSRAQAPSGAIDGRENGNLEITGSTFSGNAGNRHGAISCQRSTLLKDCLFLNNYSCDGGCLYSFTDYSATTVTGCTFYGNSGNNVGNAILTDQYGIFLLIDSYFLTPTDTIRRQHSTFIIGGTIWTAANISSALDFEIEVMEDTKLVLDLSPYRSATGMTELITGYDGQFGKNQGKLDISVNVGSEQIGGRYVLATKASNFNRTITVICPDYDEPLGTLSLSGSTEFLAYGRRYVLDNTDGILTLSISVVAGIVTPNSGDRQVVIDNQTYSGEWYADIESAFVYEELVAVKGIACDRIEVAEDKELVIGDMSLSGNDVSGDGGAIRNHGGIKIANCTFTGNVASNGGAVANSGVAVITGSTFSDNTAATPESGAFYNTGTATIRDSIFATATDTICNDNGTLTLGGTIKTAAKITSANALTILPETKLVLDISVYQTAAEMAPFLSSYNTAFSPAQENLTVSVAVAFDQAEGSYTLAADAGNFDRSITVTCDAYAKPLGTLSLNGGTEFSAYGRRYLLENDGDLTLTIIESRGIVTPDSSDHHVVVGGTAYTGTWYSDIATALANKDTVIARGIDSTRFEIDKAGKSLRMDQTTVSDHVFGKFGAGFKNDGGNISVTDSVFSGNTAAWSGGAVYNSGTVSISDSTFSGDTAGWNGGAVCNSGTVSISDSTFSGNTAGRDGGAVYNDYSCIMTISDSVFSGNSAMGDGGAFCNYSHATATISDSVFTGNAAESGGAFLNLGIVTISGSTFSGNTGRDNGGAVYNSGTVSISDSTFSGNTGWDGGAVYNSGTVSISGSTFSGNSAMEDGGAVYNIGTVSISGSTFSGNSAESGGAFCNHSHATATISDSVFSGNSAWYDGGAIYNTGTATIKNSVFETATDTIYNDGGTLVLGGTIRTAANITADKEVAVQDNTELIVDLSSYTTSEGVTEWFTDYDRMFGSTNNTQQNFSLTVNVSDETYGAYVLATGADTFDKTITVVCDAYDEPLGTLSLAAGTFTSHGKYCTLSRANGNVTLTIVQDQGIVTPDRSIIQVEIDGKNYSGRWYNSINTALQSEVTVVAQGVNKSEHVEVGRGNRKLIADHIVIAKAENIHVFSGGAINTVDSAVMEITGSTFSGNGKYVQYEGGAICSHGTTTIKNSLFIQNSVSELGGGLYCNGTTEVVGSTFSSNHASYGAGIYNEGNAIITGCVFLNNYASGGGGGICNYASATVSGCTFSGNSSYYYYNGGAIKSVSRHDVSANITVRDCFFLTALDSIRCTDYDAVMTLGGTIWTAAQIDSHNGGSIRVESGTDLILDVSVSLPGATETAILYGYDRIEGASENLSITVNIAQEQAVGIYSLVANASTFDGTITLDIEKESVASLDFITKVVLGERAYRLNRYKTYSHNDVQLVVEDVSDGKIFGGGTVSSDTVISEATGVKITDGGSFVAAAGGVYAKNAVISVNAETGVTVEDGNFSNIVCAGSIVNENTVLTVNADSTLTISGGTFAKAVAGGNYIQYAGGTIYEGSGLAKTSVNITGGTFLRDIFGGNIAAQNALATKLNCYAGSAEVTIDALENAVFIGGNIVAGSSGHGMVCQTNVTFKGSDENLHFGKNSIVCGDSHDGTMSVSCIGKDARNLSFENFTGVLDAKIVGFDKVSFSGGSVTLTKSSRLSEISVWSFSDGATLDFADDVDNDFWSDTLNIGSFDPETEWTVMTGGDLTLANWDCKMNLVTIAGEKATFQNGCWESSDYKFYREDNALKVAKLV